jgi:haloalkane dehalogenase
VPGVRSTPAEGASARQLDVVRTPEERFEALVGFPFLPRYTPVAAPGLAPLRMHYVEAGPEDGAPVLLLHGQPTWSYLYRKVLAELARHGRRAVAPDLIGFGRSDKPTDRTAYSFERHVAWTTSLVDALDLEGITLVAQDWGGPIGMAVAARRPHRFARIVAANTILHTSDPALADRLTWANHGVGASRVVLEESLVDYVLLTQRLPELAPSLFVAGATVTDPAPEVLAGYDAPFPTEEHRAGLRQLPLLVPLTRNDPGAAIDRATWDFLGGWERPFLCAFSDGDPATQGWAELFREHVPGAAGQAHTTVVGAGHFLQEDRGNELGAVVARFVAAPPPASSGGAGAAGAPLSGPRSPR